MRIVFLANVDWFFQSHFLYLAEKARKRGWEIALATHVGQSRDALAAAGLDLIELPTRRGSMAPAGLWEAATIVARELKRRPNTLLHGFGIFGIVVGGLAGRRCGIRRGVYTITGRGYSAAARTAKASVVRRITKYICRDIADGPDIRWLAENNEDFEQCGLERAVGQSRTALVGGAGINPMEFVYSPLPERPPLRVALVARMVWSKGIDTAVRAIQIVRGQGADITLALAGPLDCDNPRAFTAEQLRSFEMAGGTVWLGRVDDINGLWARHHVALLPSRGGEGLPKSLIEAAACGRPIVTTDVAGCRTFAEETGGWRVPADDPEALAGALMEAYARNDLEELGRAARETVLRSYTQDYNWGIVESLYDNLFRHWQG